MLERTESTKEHCETLLVASKLGILGAILLVITQFGFTFMIMINTETSYSLTLDITINYLNALYFVSSIFLSVGFVAVFSMKGSKLGIIFPLMVILYRLMTNLYLWIAYFLDLYSFSFHSMASIVAGYVMPIIGGLLLLTLRDRSVNKEFLTFFAIFYLTGAFLEDAVWYALFQGPIQIQTGLEYLITSIPSLMFAFAYGILRIVFFTIEGRQGCIEDSLQEVPFPD